MFLYVIGGLPSYLVFYCAAVSFLIPLTVWRINEILHQKGDPPWKQEDQKRMKGQQEGENKS
ncbi:hypothetical protein JOD43_004364 [Pullulanibacillus pueri]|uniref:Uncharacterized protein n=1 Tax=Pullulanibacillus pueri TaxID=1437324 RepID=A0A8J2ZZQ4_9BACL|nr:hypothetical protein [Pullulanibacillus pueri]MBM7684151.1 hypothetical protein [Pullulanibacillus pueri]GGH88887.1 hypothetical protein GCM10007096_42240 [Pullulanibacillus pueri]